MSWILSRHPNDSSKKGLEKRYDPLKIRMDEVIKQQYITF